MTSQRLTHLLGNRYLWLPFLFCALLLRSALPMGYMPSADAWRDGTFELTFCTADGSYSSQRLELLFAAESSSDETHQAPGHATCPAFLVHIELLPDALDSTLAVVAKSWYSYPWLALGTQTEHCAHGICGPPLGARAPPEWT
ncbi:hypothetical protein E4695_08735 [Alcaligenaceae bacterium 429]|uniref:hypothetical protein n=1 Tax=Paenalcaligenes sp. Me52 TaxID=3392038 RepID=UPI0010922029|nr:hypothetical protein E4695_08735 [Alcaligenaceae bacterium 429]